MINRGFSGVIESVSKFNWEIPDFLFFWYRDGFVLGGGGA